MKIIVIGGTGLIGSIIEIARPEAGYLKAIGHPREVVGDRRPVIGVGWRTDSSLVPLGEARLGAMRVEGWVKRLPFHA